VARLLLLGHCLCNCNENVDRQKPHAILVISRKVLEKRNHLLNDNSWRHGFDKLGQIVRCLSAHHGGVIVHKLAIVLPEDLLRWRGRVSVGDVVETGRGDF
jgi:hypothetical protein